jgi:phosphocarrier protein
MKSFHYIITDELGIHARPAGMLVKEARKFKSKMSIANGGKKSDLTKLMALMSMGIRNGADVLIEIDGEDEDSAAAYIEQFFKENL